MLLTSAALIKGKRIIGGASLAVQYRGFFLLYLFPLLLVPGGFNIGFGARAASSTSYRLLRSATSALPATGPPPPSAATPPSFSDRSHLASSSRMAVLSSSRSRRKFTCRRPSQASRILDSWPCSSRYSPRNLSNCAEWYWNLPPPPFSFPAS